MSEGLYKKSVDDSITPDLPGKNSREAEKAAAAEDARARLREGEDAATDGSGASSEGNAQDIENNTGFYNGRGEKPTVASPWEYYGYAFFGKRSKFWKQAYGSKNGKKKGGFRKYGPLAALFGMIFGIGGIVGAVQGLMPFHVVEEVTEMFDGSFTSRSVRMPRMMKSIAKMDGKGEDAIKHVPGKYTKYRKGLKKYKTKLARQGIDMVEVDGKTELRWKNHLGEDVTIKAENFVDFYEGNIDFRNDFSRGTRGIMGRIAAWIDLSAARFFSSHNLTKNLWKDWQQETFRKEGKETKFKDIIRGRRPEIAAEVGESKVEEQEKQKKVVIDGHEEMRTYEVAQMDPEYEGNGYTSKTKKAETKTAKTKTDFADRLTSIASSISNTKCAIAAVTTAAVGIGYAILQDNAQNTWQGVAEAVDKTKAGDGANSPIYDTGTYLSNKMTASAMISIVSGGKIAPSQDSSLRKLNLSSIYENVGIGAGVAVTCAIAKAAVATVSIVTTVLTGGIGKGIMSIAKTVLGGAIVGTAVGFAVNKIVDNYLGSITNDMCLDSGKDKDDPMIPNDDGGNCLAIGGLSELQKNYQGGGGTLGSMDKVAEFYDAHQLALQQEAEYDRATKSPFDATNGNTFLGSLVGSLVLPVAELSSSPAGFVSSIGGLLSSSISSLLPSASAISKTQYMANQIGDCPLAESIGAVGNSIDCSPLMITDMGTIDEDPDEVINNVVDGGKNSKAKGKKVNGVEEKFYDENFEMDGDKIALNDKGVEKIKKGSHLDKYIRYCSNRESPFGIVDQNIISAETTASANTGNGTIDTIMDSTLGAVPLLGDVIDLWNAYDEMNALQWATGANCVARSDDDTSVFASSEGAGKAKMLGMSRTGSRDEECKETDDWWNKDGEVKAGAKPGESTSCTQYPKEEKGKDVCIMPIDVYADDYDKQLAAAKESCFEHGVEVQDVEYDTLSWEEVKWYQRYVEDDRLVEAMGGEDADSAVQNLLASYEEENPVDNSTAGVIARKTGMLKEDVEVALNEMAYWEYLADYKPSDLYPTPVKHVDEAAVLERIKDNTKTELPDAPEGLVSTRVWYAPLRDRYSATA